MFRTILCPIDFSAHSLQALRYAALMASRAKGRLIVLFAEDPLLVNAAAAANYDETTLIASLHDELARVVRRTIAASGLDRKAVTLHVGIGKPHEMIHSTVKNAGCDLVVMGSHGLTGPGRLMFGSTTHRVLRRVEVPVLAVPPVRRGTPAPPRSWPGRWVLAPVDFGTKDGRDALTAARIAGALGSQLQLLHVVERADASLWQRLDLPVVSRDRLLMARAQARLDSLKARTETTVVTASRVVIGKPAVQIATAAADRWVGLVIMTRRRGQGLFGPQQGSISYQVLCRANTPVLALPSNDSWIRRAASRK